VEIRNESNPKNSRYADQRTGNFASLRSHGCPTQGDPRSSKKNGGDRMSLFEQENVIFTYTSQEAVEDGILFDLNQLLPNKIHPNFFLKYITAGLLEKGYLNTSCKNGVKDGDQGKNPSCRTCDFFLSSNGNLSCLQPSLNIPNFVDLITQAAQIFKRKPEGDYFVSGTIELPSGQKQKIFIAQNETGRYTAMLPEDY